MVAAALSANSNIRIVFVRIIGMTRDGARQTLTQNGIASAIRWTIANKDRFNIQAVVMSQGNPYYNPGPNYCPVLSTFNEAVKSLQEADLPFFAPAGNESNYTKINWPACVPEVVSIGALDGSGGMALYSNFDQNSLDFVAMGTMKLTNPDASVTNQVGTSIAAQVAAAQFLAIKTAKPILNTKQILELMTKTSVVARSAKHASGKLIDLNSALKP